MFFSPRRARARHIQFSPTYARAKSTYIYVYIYIFPLEIKQAQHIISKGIFNFSFYIRKSREREKEQQENIIITKSRSQPFPLGQLYICIRIMLVRVFNGKVISAALRLHAQSSIKSTGVIARAVYTRCGLHWCVLYL